MGLYNLSVISNLDRNKERGAYFTPDLVARSLVRWVVKSDSDVLLDPSCGDGRFLCHHKRSVGVEYDPETAAVGHRNAPNSRIHVSDFFTWASKASSRFDCIAGNPPFIRYQSFRGELRNRAREMCRALNVEISGLASSWAPFLVCAASRLKPGGRMAFVVPAEIGHATYSRPLWEYFFDHFAHVQLIAVKNKLFPDLSEDAWVLYAEGYGKQTQELHLSVLESFPNSSNPPKVDEVIPKSELEVWQYRIKTFFLPRTIRNKYLEARFSNGVAELNSVAKVGIGYVSGANDFFHLRPSTASELGIPSALLSVSVRNGKMLAGPVLTRAIVESWLEQDEPVLLLNLKGVNSIPASLTRYLESDEGMRVRHGFKCRNREPWFAVPDVTTPDAFLTYMAGRATQMIENRAACACTNSLHAVHVLDGRISAAKLRKTWSAPLTQLSCEIEGHSLGGGMLKLEPREAGRVLIYERRQVDKSSDDAFNAGLRILREWRHVSD